MTNSNIVSVFTNEELLQHWLGHRRVTRRVIETFPDDKLFTYSLGGMRSFGELAKEMTTMAAPGVRGIATGEWVQLQDFDTNGINKLPETKKELLELWDWGTEQIINYWPQIEDGRLQETDVAFGQWEGKVWWLLFYFIDNEIHHRAQSYVYLRSLDIEPPFFHE